MANEVDITVKATDAASAPMAGIAKNSESMASRVGGSIKTLGNQIGGELGELLNKGGDAFEKWGNDGVSAGTKIAGVGVTIAGIGVALGALGSADKAAEQGLDAAISAAGESVDDYKSKIAQVQSSSESFGHSAADADNALAKLTETTGDENTALEYMPLVTDLAAAKHESLAAAAQQVGQVLGGNTRLLKQYGIQIDGTTASASDLQNGLVDLSGKLQGQASAASDTFTGKLDGLKEHIEADAASLGNKLSSALSVAGTAAGILGTVIDLMALKQEKAAATALEQGEANIVEGESATAAAAANTRLAASNEAVAASAKDATAASGSAGLIGTLGKIGGVASLAAVGAYAEAQGWQQATKTAKEHGTGLASLEGGLNLVTGGAGIAANKIVDFGKSLFGSKKSTDDLSASTVYATSTTLALGTALDNTTKEFTDGADKMAHYTQAEKELQSGSLDAAQAQNTFLDSIDSITQAQQNANDVLKKSGASSTDYATATRQVNEAVLSSVSNINQMIDASIQAGDTTDQTNAKIKQWNSTLDTNAAKFGLSKGALDAMIQSYETSPKDLAYQVIVDASQALNAIGTVAGQLNYLAGLEKTDIGTYNSLVGSFNQFTLAQIKEKWTGGIGGAATGRVAGGLTWVGEQGPELVNLGPGSQVHSNPDSMRMASQSGGGGQAQVIFGSDGSELGDLILKIVRKAVRTQGGGNVQLALGRNG